MNSATATQAGPLPVFTPDGAVEATLDPETPILCRHCGGVWRYASRPTIDDPCTVAHHLVNGLSLLTWTVSRMAEMTGRRLRDFMAASEERCDGVSDEMYMDFAQLRSEMSARFGAQADLWFLHGLRIANDEMVRLLGDGLTVNHGGARG